MTTTNTNEISYQKQQIFTEEFSSNGEKSELAKTWFEGDTVDAWRHNRMYQNLNPVLNSDKGASWLTVGDGRYGRDARFILDHGSDAIASDITDVLLKEAHKTGYIKNFSKENAESLSFPDNSFDYVFCKESYHHFPRPMLALYEMLRVVRKGVVLIEPSDQYIKDNPLLSEKQTFKKLLKNYLGKQPKIKKQKRKHNFEKAGNYLYTISRREIEKLAIGMNYRAVAFKGMNDAYEEGVEFEKFSDNGPLLKIIKKKIENLNMHCEKGARDYDLLIAIIFIEAPSKIMSEALESFGFDIELLPKNPYL